MVHKVLFDVEILFRYCEYDSRVQSTCLHLLPSNELLVMAQDNWIMRLVFRNRYELEHEIYEIEVLDYQYEVNGESDSDELTAPISSSYFLILVAFLAMTFAFYVFCIAEKQFRHENCLTSNEKPKFSGPNPKDKQPNANEMHPKLVNNSKIDAEMV